MDGERTGKRITDELMRHRKVAYVNPQQLLNFFGNYRQVEYILVSEFEGCEGAIITGVYYAPDMRCFCVEMVREDWPEVEDGTMSPRLNTGYSKIIRLRIDGGAKPC